MIRSRDVESLLLVGLLILAALIALSCAPAVRLPAVHEPLDHEGWAQCAGELAEREAVALIDDLTLDAKTLLCQGVVLATAGKVDEGLELLTEAGVRDKEDHRPHYLSGRILAGEGRYEEALSAFERSEKRYAEMEVPTERLGRQVMEQDGAEQARTFLGKADKRGLCPYGCRGLLARLHHEAGDDDAARAIYDAMIEAHPEEPAAYVGLAKMANSAGRHPEEAELLRKATGAAKFAELGDPQRADVHYSLAFALYNTEKYVGATDAAAEALALKPERADWHVLAGWIALKRDRDAEAYEAFERAASLDDKLAAARTGSGDALLMMGKKRRAVESYKAAQELEPTSTVILLKLARAHAELEEYAEARALFEEAKRLDPDHLPADLVRRLDDILPAEAPNTPETSE